MSAKSVRYAPETRVMLSTTEAASRLGISCQQVYHLTRTGQIPGVTFVATSERFFTFVDPEMLRNWMADGCPGMSKQMRRKLARNGSVSAEEPHKAPCPDPEVAELL